MTRNILKQLAVGVCLLALLGCTSMAGVSVPKVMVHNGTPVIDAAGNPVVAYEFRGVGGAFGQASIGENIKGGPISIPGAALISGALGMAGRILGGVIGANVTDTSDPAPVPAGSGAP